VKKEHKTRNQVHNSIENMDVEKTKTNKNMETLKKHENFEKTKTSKT
jgi:hypothetical protein